MPAVRLFNFNLPGCWDYLCFLGQDQLQHTIGIFCLDVLGFDAGQVKATAIRAIGAFHPDNLVLLLLLHIGVALGPDGQCIIRQIQMDILLVEAGEIGLQQVVVTFIGYIGLELSQIGVTEEVIEMRAKEAALHFLHFSEGVVGAHGVVVITTGQIKHKITSKYFGFLAV